LQLILIDEINILRSKKLVLRGPRASKEFASEKDFDELSSFNSSCSIPLWEFQ
jgi:hypothetical protein